MREAFKLFHIFKLNRSVKLISVLKLVELFQNDCEMFNCFICHFGNWFNYGTRCATSKRSVAIHVV